MKLVMKINIITHREKLIMGNESLDIFHGNLKRKRYL